MTVLEPSVISTFRRFTCARIALFVFAVLIYLLVAGQTALNNWLPLTAMLFDGVLLMVYLSLPRLRLLMKDAYLPVGIAWAALGPLIQLHVLFIIFALTTFERPAFILILQPILVIFIPLVIIGWQYSSRAVFQFCIATFFLDVLLALNTYILYKPLLPGTSVLPPLIGMAFTRTVLFFFVGNMIANLVKIQREQHRRLLEANDRLAQYAATVEQLAISRERNRVARELHDVMAHTMSGVAVELEGVRAMMRVDTDRAEALLGQSLKAVRNGLSETRRALQALRASPLEDLGLGLAIRGLTESIAGRAGLQMDVQIDKDIPDYPIDVQQSFYRVAQEALTNAVTHAQARLVQVRLLREGAVLKLMVRDDGIGFDEKKLDLNQKYGLLGIRERVEMIHAHVSIASQVGVGTEILLTYDANSLEAFNG